MPRIRVYYTEVGGDNDPKDFCLSCWPDAVTDYSDNPLAEVTEDDHPDYEETDYPCESCRKPLTNLDN